MSDDDLPVMIVSGGSQGIGLAVVERALTNNHRVLSLSRTDSPKSHRAISDQFRERLVHLPVDLSHSSGIHSVFSWVDKNWKRVDKLVNNVGFSGERTSLKNMSDNEIEYIINVNLVGSMLMTREALKRMKHGGCVVNVSSTAARTGGYRLTAYAAAKAGLTQFTESIAREAADEGIRVNCIMPGIIDTEGQNFTEIERSQMEKAVPLGRLGTPEEIAQAIHWLMSEEASYICGATIIASGAR